VNWLSFTVEIIKAIAWPCLAICGLFLFRSQLRQVIAALSERPYFRLKRGQNEIEIGASQLKKESKSIALSADDERFVEAMSSVAISPRDAIRHAWEDVQSSISESLGISVTQPFELEVVLENQAFLSKDKLHLFHQLHEVRNMILHNLDIPVGTEVAVNYAEAAYRFARYIKEHKNNT